MCHTSCSTGEGQPGDNQDRSESAHDQPGAQCGADNGDEEEQRERQLSRTGARGREGKSFSHSTEPHASIDLEQAAVEQT